MNRLSPWKMRAASWLPTLALALLLSVLAFSSGRASGVPAETSADAQTDSIVDAFYLLQFDFRVAEARHQAAAKMDSLLLVAANDRLLEYKDQLKRDRFTAAGGALVAVLIMWIVQGVGK